MFKQKINFGCVKYSSNVSCLNNNLIKFIINISSFNFRYKIIDCFHAPYESI